MDQMSACELAGDPVCVLSAVSLGEECRSDECRWDDISTSATLDDEVSPASGIASEESLHREVSWSIGAKQHTHNKCKPCGFFWSQKGCMNGSECQHCHMCSK